MITMFKIKEIWSFFQLKLFRYVLEKDFEEILFSIGLNISRAQVQKLLKRYLSRDRISYRYFTDSWANKDGTAAYRPGVISDPPTAEQLAKGNSFSPSSHFFSCSTVIFSWRSCLP